MKSKNVIKRLLLVILPFLLLEIVLRLIGIGGSIVYIEHPDVGYLPAPSQRFSTMGHPIEILETGYRGPVATNRILFVGDSVTYGTAFLRDEETFPALLGGSNAGVNGWGLQNVAAFLRYIPLNSFDTVVWTIPSCDTLRSMMTLREGLISSNRKMLLRLEYLGRFIWYGFMQKTDEELDPDQFDTNVRQTLQAAQYLAEHNKKLLIVFLPYRDEMLGMEMPETPYFQKLQEIVDEAGIRNIKAAYTGDVVTLFRDPAHLSAYGNQWLAGLIGNALEKTRMAGEVN